MLNIEVTENQFSLQINEEISMCLMTALDFNWSHFGNGHYLLLWRGWRISEKLSKISQRPSKNLKPPLKEANQTFVPPPKHKLSFTLMIVHRQLQESAVGPGKSPVGGPRERSPLEALEIRHFIMDKKAQKPTLMAHVSSVDFWVIHIGKRAHAVFSQWSKIFCLRRTTGFLPGIFSGGGAKSIVMQISSVMLIFLLFSD